MLFSFSLKSKAKNWLNSFPSNSITTRDSLAHKFLAKYFLPAKIVRMRNNNMNFLQMEIESMYEAWERFKDLLRKCPHHEIPS